jgi:hypothetical protein
VYSPARARSGSSMLSVVLMHLYMHQSDAFVESAPSGLGADLGNQLGSLLGWGQTNWDRQTGHGQTRMALSSGGFGTIPSSGNFRVGSVGRCARHRWKPKGHSHPGCDCHRSQAACATFRTQRGKTASQEPSTPHPTSTRNGRSPPPKHRHLPTSQSLRRLPLNESPVPPQVFRDWPPPNPAL